VQRDRQAGQMHLFAVLRSQKKMKAPALPDAPDWDNRTRLQFEKESLGFYVTGHPLSKYREAISSLNVRRLSELENVTDRQEIQVAGVIGGIKKVKTKGKAETMAYLTLEGEEGSIEVLVFPEMYRNMSEVLTKESLVVVKGTVDKTEKGIKIISKEILRLEDLIAENGPQKVVVTIKSTFLPGNLKRLRELLSAFNGKRGRCQVYLRIEANDSLVDIATCLHIEPSPLLLENVEELMGKGTVEIG